MNTRDMIKKHEGFSETIYTDTKGILTVGYGHALLEGSKIRRTIADLLFAGDYAAAKTDYDRLCKNHNIPELNDAREAVLIDMLFNLGYPRLTQFKRMIAALQEKNFGAAAKEMLDSKWAIQVKGRADELAEIMRKGVME